MPVFTEVLPIDNATGASFQLPQTEDVKVMAVRVSIDNSGGADTEPELAMLAPTGAVIATERQSEAIPAGDSGMASWALRLAKKAGGTSTGGLQFGGIPIPYTYGATNVGGYLQVEARDKQAVWGFEFLCASGAGGFHVQTEDAAGVIELDAHGANSGISLTTNNDSTFILGPGAGSLIVNFVGGQGRYQWVANTRLGFFGAVPVSKPAVTGSRGGNAALASLLTQLVNLGLITNSTTP